MKSTTRRAYDEIREIVERRGGTMRYQRSGYRFGAWVIALDGKTVVLESTGRRVLSELDSLYVPKVPKPATWDDYQRELVEDAEERLLRLLGLSSEDRPASKNPGLDRRAKAALHMYEGPRLNEAWGVGAAQARYSHDGHWYARLVRFPAALFDAHGYVLFATEEEYLSSPHLNIGKQISVPQPGISGMPGYVRVVEPEAPSSLDVDIHRGATSEGRRRLVCHLQRERNRAVVDAKKKQATSLDCEICGFSFGKVYGPAASEYCEAHHLKPLSEVEDTAQTRMEDLAILCANCHRVVHLRNPPYSLSEVREMLNR